MLSHIWDKGVFVVLLIWPTATNDHAAARATPFCGTSSSVGCLNKRIVVRRRSGVNAYARQVAAVGVIDESSPEIGADQVVYTMALVIFDDADQDLVRQMLTATLNRRRPLHWEREGTVVKQRIVDLLCVLPVTAHACASIVHRSTQQAARVRLLREHLLERAGVAGAGQLSIEQRSKAEDDLDRREVRDWFRTSPHRFHGIEHVTKTEPLAWMPDTIAGIWADVVRGRGDGFIEQLVESGRLLSLSRE